MKVIRVYLGVFVHAFVDCGILDLGGIHVGSFECKIVTKNLINRFETSL